MSYQIAILAIFTFFALVEAKRHGLINKNGEVSDDWKVELIGSLTLFIVTQPLVLLTAGFLAQQTFPQFENALIETSLFLHFALLLVFDDMSQYWWHRMSHKVRPLYNLHRAHHNAKYMSVRIIYRNNVFYYLLMPSLWFSGVLIYLGLGWSYAIYLVVKLTVITGAHAEWKWDRPLYKLASRFVIFEPLVWIIERTISTPSTHSAHHGLHMDDGVTYYKGNYGNLLFFWDVLFRTAKISRGYPTAFGVEGMRKADWKEQLLWPLVKSKPRIKKATHAIK